MRLCESHQPWYYPSLPLTSDLLLALVKQMKSMSSGPIKLDSLPIEILRRIASVGTCEAALALSKVNRTLHTTCNDRLVYKQIIENRNGNLGATWHHHLPLSMESSVSSWARYALADSKAAQDYALSPEPRAFVPWAPQLMAYHHPFIDLANALILTDAFKLVETKTPNYAEAFCLALRLMSKEPAGDLGTQWPTQNESTPFARTRKNMTHYLKQPLYMPGVEASYFSAYNPRMLMQKRAQALVTVGLFSVILREAIELGRIMRVQNMLVEGPSMAVPTSSSIPFHLMMDLPLPFSPSATTEFATCHLAKMTTADFLEDGEWTGFYSLSSIRQDTIAFDPPMHGIQFVATPQGGSSRTLKLRATGEDGIQAFDLEGEIVSETGRITLEKRYLGGHPTWDWVCMMTPMGIVGSWGRNHFGGWIWLWKVGWTAGR